METFKVTTQSGRTLAHGITKEQADAIAAKYAAIGEVVKITPLKPKRQ